MATIEFNRGLFWPLNTAVSQLSTMKIVAQNVLVTTILSSFTGVKTFVFHTNILIYLSVDLFSKLSIPLLNLKM